MIAPGDIFSAEAYAQGKMLDHSGWYGKLPRGSRPSDIDFASATVEFDNNGAILLAELSRMSSRWNEISRGQKWLYESSIKFSPHCAVLCHHSAPLDRKIDTYNDVIDFQPMVWDYDFIVGPVFVGNDKWHLFVERWYRNSLRLRRYLICEHYHRIFKGK
jgi:hypothetical protein